jgi:prepilin-type N-terminal cleavage/methylation domain-containing protein
MIAPGHMRSVRNQHGFTLIEALVTLAILPIVLTAIVLMLTTFTHFTDETQSENTLQTQARAAIDRLTQDLRAAYTGSTTSPPIESLSGTTITFDSPDRSTPFHLRRISYQLVSGTLQRAYATSTNTAGPPWTFPAQGGWSEELTNVSNPTIFGYYDSSGAVTTDPSQVREVTVNVTVSTINKRPFSYSGTVLLRNQQ